MAISTIGTNSLASGAVTNSSIAVGAGISTSKLGTGAVLQVVNAVKTDTFSSSSGTWVDVTGLSVSVTPTSASSKILIFAVLQAVNQSSTGSTMRLMRDSTAIGIATSVSNRQAGSSSELYTGRSDNFFSSVANYLDSPATTSSVTYKVQAQPNGYNLYVNRSVADTDSSGYTRGVSYITVMEIAG